MHKMTKRVDSKRIQNLVLRHTDSLFDWIESFDSRIFNPVDHDMWNEELWTETGNDIEDVLRKVRERFERVGEYWPHN